MRYYYANNRIPIPNNRIPNNIYRCQYYVSNVLQRLLLFMLYRSCNTPAQTTVFACTLCLHCCCVHLYVFSTRFTQARFMLRDSDVILQDILWDIMRYEIRELCSMFLPITKLWSLYHIAYINLRVVYIAVYVLIGTLRTLVRELWWLLGKTGSVIIIWGIALL